MNDKGDELILDMLSDSCDMLPNCHRPLSIAKVTAMKTPSPSSATPTGRAQRLLFYAILCIAFTLTSCGSGGGGSSGGGGGGGGGGTNDLTPPSIVITVPTTASEYATSSASISLEGVATDDVGVSEVTWSNNLGGSGTATGTTSWSIAAIALQPGRNTITVTVRDTANKVTSASLVVSYGAVSGELFYISPGGSDANDGRSQAKPWLTFARAFAYMNGGDELILLDGVYSAATGTGTIHWNDGVNSAQPPSGTSLSATTYIHALNPGQVVIDGGLFLGRSSRKDSYIRIEGITFEGGGELYNTSDISILNSGFHSESQGGSVLSIGTNDLTSGSAPGNPIVNSNILLQDIWVWGKERITFIVYRAESVVVRRAVVRNDGCDSFTYSCGNNSGNAMVGTTIYNANNVSFQNVIVIDSVIGPGGRSGAGDLYTAWHNNFIHPWHNNEWLGTISLNSALGTGYGFDLDPMEAPAQPMATYRDIVAWDSESPFSAQCNGSNAACQLAPTLSQNVIVSNGTFRSSNTDASSGSVFRVAPSMLAEVQDVKNVVATGTAKFGVISPSAPRNMNVFGTFGESSYYGAACTGNCFTSDPRADGASPSLKYITRIEAGSKLKGAGESGADIGANILTRYGADGSRYGDTGYNTLTATALWPWPNQAKIKSQMCVGTTRGFCASGNRLDDSRPVSLTSYIWEYLGNPVPADIEP